ncbi:carbon-phosphorus lyase complex subunit PhnI [Sporolactobacillus sp. CQH2019]|uniref:carbon-phosphorus lyase complex subunit PhnI n=1 Tax=Sporolactobacillus sp. CQH2019 TaxID=3023512 RepID=UPI002368E4C6|nr:carbon-phosphorus lyase complex subunit PhnI [Sporolactobacillus sp. CQH2019]MDD9150022.1 carbon-phosphorus lyase complex subunit PhnI [Sporolactobacillus sp. CQH2019]
MGYVAVTGGQEAIEAADHLTQWYRLKDADHSLKVSDIEHQMRLLIDRVMGEGGLYAPEYAAIALKQAEGDPAEAAFLLRAYRSTLARNYYSETVEPEEMRIIRRISSSFKDIPGGQMLGPTYDYRHRLLNFDLRNEDYQNALHDLLDRLSIDPDQSAPLKFRKVTDLLREQGLLGKSVLSEEEPFDMTRQKLTFPAPRSARLQALARGETGAMTALAYSSLRGYGAVHPTIGELRVGYAEMTIPYPYDEQESLYIGEVMLTEVETINSFTLNDDGAVTFRLGYGLTFGQNETKAIAMAILEQSLETEGESPTQDEEFVLLHIDSVEANGFVSHLKLPHYITFQSKLDVLRQSRKLSMDKKKHDRQISKEPEM